MGGALELSLPPDSMRADFLGALALLLVGSLAGLVWNPAALRNATITMDTAPKTADYLTEIDREEVLRGLHKGSLCVVDSRQRSFYEAGHIPGSLPIWDAEIEFMIQILYRLIPLSTQVVVVDEESRGFGGRRIAGLFASRGYKNVKLLKGGLSSWRAEGRPIIQGWDFEGIKKWGMSK